MHADRSLAVRILMMHRCRYGLKFMQPTFFKIFYSEFLTGRILRNFIASFSDLKSSPHIMLFLSSPPSSPPSLSLPCPSSHWKKQGEVLCSSVPVGYHTRT